MKYKEPQMEIIEIENIDTITDSLLYDTGEDNEGNIIPGGNSGAGYEDL